MQRHKMVYGKKQKTNEVGDDSALFIAVETDAQYFKSDFKMAGNDAGHCLFIFCGFLFFLTCPTHFPASSRYLNI